MIPLTCVKLDQVLVHQVKSNKSKHWVSWHYWMKEKLTGKCWWLIHVILLLISCMVRYERLDAWMTCVCNKCIQQTFKMSKNTCLVWLMPLVTGSRYTRCLMVNQPMNLLSMVNARTRLMRHISLKKRMMHGRDWYKQKCHAKRRRMILACKYYAKGRGSRAAKRGWQWLITALSRVNSTIQDSPYKVADADIPSPSGQVKKKPSCYSYISHSLIYMAY